MDATRSHGRAALLLALLLWPAMHAAPAHAQRWRQPEFVIGAWIDPLHGGYSMDRTAIRRGLQQAADAHFNLLTGAPSHCPTNHWTDVTIPDLDYLANANELGFHAMQTHPTFTGCLREDCDDDRPPILNPFMVNAVLSQYDEAGADAITRAQNDALLGYMLWDEPNFTLDRADYMKDWIEAMHLNDIARDDGHARMTYVNFQAGLGCSDYPDWDTAVQAFLTDPDSLRRVDVASVTLYSLHGATDQPTYAQYFRPLKKMRDWMHPRPFWALGVLNGQLSATSRPDDDQLRFFAYASAAAGAKGLIWFTYGPGCPDPCTNPAAYDTAAAIYADAIPTRRYGWVRTINHYLRDVVGPVAMAAEHVGLFHETTSPTMEPVPLIAANATLCPVATLGDPNLAVGVFRPAGASGDLFLFVVNKSVNPATANVTLQSPYFIQLAPRALDYVGGKDYSALGSGTQVSFPLAGGEGRMVRLTPAQTPDLALLDPQGGTAWLPGETRLVRWSSAGAPVTLELVTQVREGGDLTGPRVPLGSGLTGGEALVTMPDVAAREARLVLSAVGTDGQLRRVAAPRPFSVVAPAPRNPSFDAFGSGAWFATGTVAIDAAGTPHVAWTQPDGVLRYARPSGGSWSVETIPKITPGPQGDVQPAMAIDAAGNVHLAWFGTDGGNSLRINAALVYARRAPGGSWTSRLRLAVVGDATGRPAIAAAGNGDVFVAYNTGSIGGRRVNLLRLAAGSSTFQGWGVAVGGDPRSICLRVDSSNIPWVGYTAGGVARIDRMGATAAESMLALPGGYRALSFALDASDHPIVALGRADAAGGAHRGRAILHARRHDGTAWGAERVVDPTAGTIDDIAVALHDGRARIAYIRNGVARYARETPAGWVCEVADQTALAAEPVSLAFAPNGDRRVGYFDRRLGAFRTATAPDDTTSGVPGPECCGAAPVPAPALALQLSNPAPRAQMLQLAIAVDRPGSVELQLFDVAGRRVAHRPAAGVVAGTSVVQLPIGALPPGVYLIRASWDRGPAVTRRVVVR
jgi:hypothetical protein